MEGKLNLKTEEESWLTVLRCRRPNKVSCKNHPNTPGISMHTFRKEARRKQKWTTFARIHRLACQRNTLPCAPSILKHYVSSEVCLFGYQWISRGFTLRKVQYCQCTQSQKIHWTWLPKKWGRTCKSIFPEKRSLDVSLGPPPSLPVSKIPPPPKKKKSISFQIGKAYSRYVSGMTDPRPFPRGLTYFSLIAFNEDMPSSNQQQFINCKNRYCLGVRETLQGKTPPSQKCKGRFWGKSRFVLSLPWIILKQARYMV